MSKIPFERFIIALLLSNKSIPFIVEKLKSFHYHITDAEVSEVFDDMRSILPPSITEHINAGNPLDLSNETHVQWLKQLNVFEAYDCMHGKYTEKPPYFKWMDDIIWAHTYEDVMTLINIFMFNGEPKESISNIITFKYRRKIGAEALAMYESLFWNSANITAKEAMYHCEPFRTNTVIVRKLRNGNTEIETIDDDAIAGSDVSFLFYDNNYIKWKIGYKDVKIPTSKEFFESVKKDSYFKYQESMNMTQSVDVLDEDGNNDKLGAFNLHRISRKNVEEQKAKLVKQWLDIYLTANESAPEGEEKEEFFKQLGQVSLDFNDDEVIVDINNAKDILNDIKGDLS